MTEVKRSCKNCGENVKKERWALGYRSCIECATKHPEQIKRTIVPLSKSNYIVVTDLTDLKGLNKTGN